MSRGLGAVQRRLLETLEHIEREAPGAWVMRRSLVTPKEGQKIERSDESSTARAINGLAERGLVEVKPDWAWHVRTPIVRLIKNGRPPLLDSAEDRKLQRELDQKISAVNRDLRMRGSRIRVTTEDLGEYEYSTVAVGETGRSYSVVHLYREALEPPRRG
ncbi:hypothetical protein [Streptomyces hirsutus]|uniref:hypothetical protein n=1 Tax=Streptomyces hirsutus TaxID=35620 RepID=UPI0033B140F9